MSNKLDNDFQLRLAQAAKKARVEFLPQAVGTFLGVNRQTAATWMAGSIPRADTLFEIAEQFGVDAKWLATGQGDILSRPPPDDFPADEQLLIERYRGADPRWRLSLQLLAALAIDDQIEAASDVNMVIARISGMKPQQLRPAGDKRMRDILKNSREGWPPKAPEKERS